MRWQSRREIFARLPIVGTVLYRAELESPRGFHHVEGDDALSRAKSLMKIIDSEHQ